VIDHRLVVRSLAIVLALVGMIALHVSAIADLMRDHWTVLSGTALAAVIALKLVWWRRWRRKPS
jgi:hypothetical protein